MNNYLPLILRRAARRITLLLILAFGVVLSTALLSSAPTLVDAVIEFGLPRRLRAAALNDPLDTHLRLTTFANLGETDYHPLNDSIQTPIRTRFGNHLSRIALIVQSHWMFPWVENTLLPNERVNFRYLEGLEDQVQLLAGVWPAGPDTNSGEPQTTASALISEAMAAYYELQPSDLLPLSHNDNASNPDFTVIVSGIIRPLNVSDPYWMGKYNPLQSQSNKRYIQQFGVLIPGDTFFPLIAELFPKARSELSWHVLFDPATITTTRLPALANNLGRLSDDFPSTVAYETGLRDVLIDFYTQTQGIRLPIYLLTSEIVLLALAYVVMTAGQHVRAIESEFAILRSRGASGQQIVHIQLVEATLIAGVALLSGPGFGTQLVILLERFGPLADVSDARVLLTPSQAAWTAALVGAVACIVSLLFPVFPALRRSIVAHVQSTGRMQKPLWQRLYLDVALLALGLILLFRLHLYGGLNVGETAPRVDWLLLLSPLALLLGSATLIIRLAPPVLGLISRAISLGRGLPAPLAFWQTARNPNQFAGIVLLLTLANALGILAVGLNTTLDSSEFERARYAVGGDIRLETESALTGQYATPEITNTSTAMRGTGTIDLKTYHSFPAFDLLAIDPVSFSKVTVYRRDYADEPMGDLLSRLVMPRDKLPGLELPGEPTEIGIWVYAPDDNETVGGSLYDGYSNRDRVGITAKILTQAGVTLLVPLEDARPCAGVADPAPDAPSDACPVPRWAYFTADLPDLAPNDYPLSLHSVWMRNRARINGVPASFVNLTITLDEIGVTDRNTGETSTVEDFEDPVRIVSHEFRAEEAGAAFNYTKIQAYGGEASGRLQLIFTRALQSVGLIFNIAERDNPILPALVSPRFLETTGLKVGDVVNTVIREQAILFEIKGVVTYFPSMVEEQQAGFLLTARESLLLRLGNDNPLGINPNEIWLDMEPGSGLADIPTGEATRIWDTETIRQVMKADPLALGLRSVTFLGYLLTTLLSIVGFATHFTLSVRQRSTSFGILRAMGLSPVQLYGSLALEQALIILTGLGLGALLGTVLNQIVLPGLPITLAGQTPIPPFIPVTNWRPIGQVFATLIIVFALTFGVATWALWRGKMHQALRIGQE